MRRLRPLNYYYFSSQAEIVFGIEELFFDRYFKVSAAFCVQLGLAASFLLRGGVVEGERGQGPWASFQFPIFLFLSN
jgi:hypothetical protein